MDRIYETKRKGVHDDLCKIDKKKFCSKRVFGHQVRLIIRLMQACMHHVFRWILRSYFVLQAFSVCEIWLNDPWMKQTDAAKPNAFWHFQIGYIGRIWPSTLCFQHRLSQIDLGLLPSFVGEV